MKALTIYQPYAIAIVSGIKRYEIRPRRTDIRGRVAIHAGKKRIHFDRFAGCGVALPAPDLWHYGAVIGTVEIVDCVPVEAITDNLDFRFHPKCLMGDFGPGQFAYVLRFPEKFKEPIPAKGKQGWWNWNESQLPARVCETCHFFETYEGVCLNIESGHGADFVGPFDHCPEWKPKPPAESILFRKLKGDGG